MDPGNTLMFQPLKITMPEKGTILQFKNHKHSMRVPTVVYVDFESFTKPIQTCQIIQKKATRKLIKSMNLRVSIIALFVTERKCNQFSTQNKQLTRILVKYL